MTVSVKKWGNSLALRIPKDVAKSLSLEDSSQMELTIEDKILTLKPKEDNYLESLVMQINESNRHHGVDTGVSVGHEEW
ncbi:MAG: AbrB/MazE/SpoVT family DNA-binding domain-containing protein [Campylobacterota bacterium]|nr:AbrB/MazE/SpoVT family DNA-binding domain-containing protein [Campylobacterota bacterium]